MSNRRRCCCTCPPHDKKPMVTCWVENDYFYFEIVRADTAVLIHYNLVTEQTTETPIVITNGEASGGPIPIIIDVDRYTVIAYNRCGQHSCSSWCEQPVCGCNEGNWPCGLNYYINSNRFCPCKCHEVYVDGILFNEHPGYVDNFPSNDYILFPYPAPPKHTIKLVNTYCNNTVECEIINPCFSQKTGQVGIISGLSDINHVKNDSGSLDQYGPGYLPTGPFGIEEFYPNLLIRYGTYSVNFNYILTGLSNLNGTYAYSLPRDLENFECPYNDAFITDLHCEITVIDQYDVYNRIVTGTSGGIPRYSEDFHHDTHYSYTKHIFDNVIHVYNLVWSDSGDIVLSSTNWHGISFMPEPHLVRIIRTKIETSIDPSHVVENYSTDITYHLCNDGIEFRIPLVCGETTVVNGEQGILDPCPSEFVYPPFIYYACLPPDHECVGNIVGNHMFLGSFYLTYGFYPESPSITYRTEGYFT